MTTEEPVRLEGTASDPKGRRRGRRAAFAVVLVVLVLVLGGAAYAVWGGGSQDLAGVPGLQPGKATIVSLSQLERLAAAQGPIYWAGPIKGTHYEVTVTPAGNTYVRYLPNGVTVGSPQKLLTVGTYTSIDGYAALTAAKKHDANVRFSRSNAVIATFHSAPNSVYFAFPNSTFEVEVFSPIKGKSRRLTDAGTIGLVPGSQ